MIYVVPLTFAESTELLAIRSSPPVRTMKRVVPVSTRKFQGGILSGGQTGLANRKRATRESSIEGFATCFFNEKGSIVSVVRTT